MKENEWNIGFSESVREALEQLNKNQISTSALAMSQAWRAAIPDYKLNGAYTVLNEIVASHKAWCEKVLPSSTFSERMATAYPTLKMEMPSISLSILAQVDTSAFAAFRESISAAMLVKTDWSWLSEVQIYDSEDETENISEEMITQEIRSEIAADITQVLSNPENMEAVSQSKYLQWKARNPGLAALFLEILYPFLLAMIQIFVPIWLARPVKDSQVYEKPTATSNMVCNITIENTVTVIGDVPYYYEIEFVHPETGEMVTGYVYKGNVAAEEAEETEAQVEETEPVEDSEHIPDTTVVQTEPTE